MLDRPSSSASELAWASALSNSLLPLPADDRGSAEQAARISLIAAGGNIYYLAKLAAILGLNVQDIGALQTGLSVDQFKAKLLAHAEEN